MELSDLTTGERARLDRELRAAESRSRIEFSIHTGAAPGDTRAYAQELHGTLVAPQRSTLFMIDSTRRALEIITGSDVRARVSDDQVAAVAGVMTERLAQGELFGALSAGIAGITEAATQPV